MNEIYGLRNDINNL